MKKNNLNNVLITGGSGMIGSEINFGEKPSRKELDVSIPDNVSKVLNFYNPKIILHLAALTNIKECENNPAKAYEINMNGTLNIALACRKQKIKLIYLSTCAVFDGKKKKPYTENDVPQPLSVYGKSKKEGEDIIKNVLTDFLILRTGWVFGKNMPSHKFIKICFNKLKLNENVSAVNDRIGSPTYSNDLIEKIIEMIEKKQKGIIHVVNDKTASYYDIGIEIKKIKKFNSLIIPVKSKEIEKNEFHRGKMEALVSKKIKLRPWQKSLKEYINSLI